MASPFAPPTEDEDESPYYGQGAQTLLAPPDTTFQNASPPPPPPPTTAPPVAAQQGPQIAPPSPGQKTPTILFPTAPTPPPDNLPAYKVLTDKESADGKREKVAPKWWERLAGAAVGFGAGYGGGAEAGIRAGSAVTNRGQVAADADRASRLAQDQQDIENFQKQQDMSRKAYEDQVTNFGAQMQGASAQQSQANSDRSFQRETDNDKRSQDNADNTLDYEQQVHGDLLKQQGIENQNETSRIGETSRHNRATEANEAEIRATVKAGSTAAQLKQGQDQIKADAVRQAALKVIDNGDPKTGTDGYNQRLKDLQTTKKNNPSTGQPYTDEERTAAIQELNDEHAADKAHIESTYAESLNSLGIPAQEVQYGPDGKTPLNNSNGLPPVQQQPPPPAPPKAGKPLTDVTVAKRYLAQAGGDKNKARALAKKDGYTF